VNHALRVSALILPLLAVAPAVGAPLKTTADPPPTASGAPVTGSRISDRFPTLEAYLAWLEKRSHMDGPWYRQVRPGVYELQTGNLRLDGGGPAQRTFTRDELAKKFGFAQ
jgi:hypothetical protein